MRKNNQSNRRKWIDSYDKKTLWEFNLYWKFMCTDENNDIIKKNYPL